MHTWHLAATAAAAAPGNGIDNSKVSSSRSSSAIHAVAWCPNPSLQLLSAAVDNRVVLLPSGLGGQEVEAAAAAALTVSDRRVKKLHGNHWTLVRETCLVTCSV